MELEAIQSFAEAVAEAINLRLQTWKMEEKSIGKYGEITKISNDV